MPRFVRWVYRPMKKLLQLHGHSALGLRRFGRRCSRRRQFAPESWISCCHRNSLAALRGGSSLLLACLLAWGMSTCMHALWPEGLTPHGAQQFVLTAPSGDGCFPRSSECACYPSPKRNTPAKPGLRITTRLHSGHPLSPHWSMRSGGSVLWPNAQQQPPNELRNTV